jgi:hypothetical protein
MAPDGARADRRSRTDAVLLSLSGLRASSAFGPLVRGCAGGAALRLCAEMVRQSSQDSAREVRKHTAHRR